MPIMLKNTAKRHHVEKNAKYQPITILRMRIFLDTPSLTLFV